MTESDPCFTLILNSSIICWAMVKVILTAIYPIGFLNDTGFDDRDQGLQLISVIKSLCGCSQGEKDSNEGCINGHRLYRSTSDPNLDGGSQQDLSTRILFWIHRFPCFRCECKGLPCLFGVMDWSL